MSKYVFTKDAGESPLIGVIKRGAKCPARVPRETVDKWLRSGLLREIEVPKRKLEVKKDGRN